MVISGFVSVTIQEMTDSSPRRITSASDRPIRRALSRCFGGSLIRQDGNKHQVVDTEHNFQNDKRQQAGPD